MVSREAYQQDRGLLDDRWVDLDAPEPGSGSCECGLSKTDVGEAGDLLGCRTEDIGRSIAEVPELRVSDLHGLLAQAMQRLLMLLDEPAALLSALTGATGKTAREN